MVDDDDGGGGDGDDDDCGGDGCVELVVMVLNMMVYECDDLGVADDGG